MRDPGLVATFNTTAATYDEDHGATCGVAHELALAAVTRRGIAPECVLDIGCGTGVLLERVSERWPDAVLAGVDPAYRMIEIAERRLPGVDFQVAVAERLPTPDHSVDLVLSTTSFNHWSDHRRALREVARVLVPGGHVVVVEHAPPGPLVGAMLRLSGRMVHHHSMAELARLPRAGGLRPLRITLERGGFLCLLAQLGSAPTQGGRTS